MLGSRITLNQPPPTAQIALNPFLTPNCSQPPPTALTAATHPQVSDFGLSQVLDMFETAGGSTTGASTPTTSGGGGGGAPQCFGALTHAAPELVRGEPMSRESDVYAVGVLLWELLTCEVRRAQAGRGVAVTLW